MIGRRQTSMNAPRRHELADILEVEHREIQKIGEIVKDQQVEISELFRKQAIVGMG